MSSEKPKSKRKQEEEKLYLPIKNELEYIFERYVQKNEKQTYQSRPLPSPESRDVYFEITAKRHISDILKRQFDDYTLYIMRVEGFYPDIMGFVCKDRSSSKELVTVEVKSIPITIKHIERAKTYQYVFDATYGLVVSSKGIPEELRRFVSNRPRIRRDLIIAQYVEHLHMFKIHPDFEPHIPEPFKQFAKPKP